MMTEEKVFYRFFAINYCATGERLTTYYKCKSITISDVYVEQL